MPTTKTPWSRRWHSSCGRTGTTALPPSKGHRPMTTRPAKGHGLSYHRDSEAHSELAPPQYVEWARGEAARLVVSFSGTPEAITAVIARNQSADGDLYLD